MTVPSPLLPGSTPPGGPLPPGVIPNAWSALGGIWRLTFRRFATLQYWLTSLGLLLALGLFAFAATGHNADPESFSRWAGSVYLRFLVPVLAFASTAGALRDDLKPGVGDYLFTRPLRRPLYLLFRYLSQTAAVQLDFLPAFGVVAALGLALKIPLISSLLPLLFLSQVLLIFSFGALGLLCGVLTSRYLIVGLIYGAVVETGLGSIPTALNQLALSRQVLAMTEPLLNSAASGRGNPAISPAGPGSTTALMFAITAGLLALAAVLFSRQERTGDPAKD